MVNYRGIHKKDNASLAVLIRNIFVAFNAHHHKGTIYTDPSTDNLFELFQKDNSVCWVATMGNKIVGCCGIYPTQGLSTGSVELVKFYVAQESRGKGIGMQLFTNCIRSAKILGYDTMYLESLPEFEHAVRLYEYLGFEHLTTPLGDSGHHGCTIWMKKELK